MHEFNVHNIEHVFVSGLEPYVFCYNTTLKCNEHDECNDTYALNSMYLTTFYSKFSIKISDHCIKGNELISKETPI